MADLLIHDGMFLEEDLEKAQARGHSTAAEAAQVARRARATRLALTHMSPRYRGAEERFLAEARAVFPETVIAHDLMEMEIRPVSD
jgi:ribonuclease Z